MRKKMKAISVGRIVTKLMGREAGRRAVVTELIDRNFVEITGPYDLTGVKRRRVNINHIEPSDHVLDIKKGSDDATITSAIEADDDIKTFMEEKLV